MFLIHTEDDLRKVMDSHQEFLAGNSASKAYNKVYKNTEESCSACVAGYIAFYRTARKQGLNHKQAFAAARFCL